MKKYIIEMRRGLKWKKTWWTVEPKTYPFPVSIPAVGKMDAKTALKRAEERFPNDEYRIAEVGR